MPHWDCIIKKIIRMSLNPAKKKKSCCENLAPASVRTTPFRLEVVVVWQFGAASYPLGGGGSCSAACYLEEGMCWGSLSPPGWPSFFFFPFLSIGKVTAEREESSGARRRGAGSLWWWERSLLQSKDNDPYEKNSYGLEAEECEYWWDKHLYPLYASESKPNPSPPLLYTWS